MILRSFTIAAIVTAGFFAVAGNASANYELRGDWVPFHINPGTYHHHTGGSTSSTSGPGTKPTNGGPDAIFLCEGSTMVVIANQDALATINAGAVEANALAGNVEGANNIGTYHLTCSTAYAPTGSWLGGAGEVYGPEVDPQLGFYPIVEDPTLTETVLP